MTDAQEHRGRVGSTVRRFFRIVRHPVRWAFGACFICGALMLFDDPRLIGNGNGFCWTHGEDGAR